MHADFSLLRHQRPMLQVVGRILLNAFSNNKKEIRQHLLRSDKHNIYPNSEIVERYHKWLGCEKSYPTEIAPHLFPLWTYPQLFEMGRSMNLPLHKVLNQGVKMTINSPLKRDSALNCHAEIYQIQNMEQKIRISQRLTTGTHQRNDALVSEIYAVILKDTKKILKQKAAQKLIDTSKMTSIGSLQITKEDAKSYAYLSGDVNPIHLSKNIAKLMGLKGSIMHGFGLFAMIFEKLQAQHFNLSEIDVRFIKPVYLGTEIDIFLTQSNKENTHGIKVISRDKKHLHMAGEFKYSDILLS